MNKTRLSKIVNVSVRTGAFVALSGVMMMAFQNCSRFNSMSSSATLSSSSAISPVSTPVTSASPTPAPTPTPAANGAQLLWDEEFNGTSVSWNDGVTGGTWVSTSLNGSVNGDGSAGWGSEFNLNPVNSYNINPFSVSGGMLTIRADNAPANIAAATGRSYISGGMRTAKLDFGNGYYEASAKVPSGSGMWPAFWLLPGDFSWPPEIDIIEYLGNSPTVDFTTVHSTVQFPNANNWGHWQLGAANDIGVDLSQGFHTYGVDFEPDKITFYCDHVAKFSTVTPADLVNRKMYIVLNLAINGWGGSNNIVNSATVFPADYKVDYVRYYSAVPF